jgi:hypothetical protein
VSEIGVGSKKRAAPDGGRYSVSDKAPGDVPCGDCVNCVCVGGKLVVDQRSNGQAIYMQYRSAGAARAAGRRVAEELLDVEVILDWVKEPVDIKVRSGMTHDAIKSLPFVMRQEDAMYLRAVVRAGEEYLAVLKEAHGHFDELMTAVQVWTHQHAVEFGLSCDVGQVQLTVDKGKKLLELGGASS